MHGQRRSEENDQDWFELKKKNSYSDILMGPGIHADVTLTRTIYLNIPADAKKGQESSGIVFIVWPPNFPDLYPVKRLSDVLNKSNPQRPRLTNLQDLKDPLLIS